MSIVPDTMYSTIAFVLIAIVGLILIIYGLLSKQLHRLMNQVIIEIGVALTSIAISVYVNVPVSLRIILTCIGISTIMIAIGSISAYNTITED